MVGIRFFLVFIMVFFLSLPLYALRHPSVSYKEDSVFEDSAEDLADTLSQEAREIKKEKEKISKEIIEIRNERQNTLKPFVSPVKKPHTEIFTDSSYKKNKASNISSVPVKNYELKSEEPDFSSKPKRSKVMFNVTFFFILAVLFLVGHFLIKPK